MSSIFSWNLLFYATSFFAVMLIFTIPGRQFSVRTKLYLNKMKWGLAVISSFYWMIAVPYVGWTSIYPTKLEIPIEQNQTEYIKSNQIRIEDLEKQVEKSNRELRELREHYNFIIQLMMYGIMFYGANKLFPPKKIDLENIEENELHKL
jgi:hypothetical protein